MRYSLGVIVSLLLFLSACSSTPGVTPMNPSTPYPPSTSMVTGNPAIHDEDTVIPGFSDSGGVFPSEDTVVVKPPIYEPLILGTGSLRTKLYVVDDILVLHTADDAPREVGKWRDDFRVVDTAKGYYTIGKKLYFVSKEEPLGKYEPRKIKRYPCVGGIELDKKFYVYGKEYTTRKLPVNKRCEAIGLSDGSGVYIAEYPESGELRYIKGIDAKTLKEIPRVLEAGDDPLNSIVSSTGALVSNTGTVYLADENGIRLKETCTASGCEYFKVDFTMDEYLDGYDYSIVRQDSTGAYTVYTTDPRRSGIQTNNFIEPSCLDFGDSVCINFITKDGKILYTNYIAGINRNEKLPIGKDIGGLYKITPYGAIFYNRFGEGTSCGGGGKKLFTYINFATLETIYEENIDTKVCNLKSGYENSECSETSCDWQDQKSQTFYRVPVKNATPNDKLNLTSTDIESAYFEYYRR